VDSLAVTRARHRRNAVPLLVNVPTSSIPHPRMRSDMKMFKKPGASRAYRANVNLSRIEDLPHSAFFHVVREIDRGVKYRDGEITRWVNI